ncbi:MAG: GldG family protein [Bacteroidetes bacterium]|nr:GldG family protein [Bacteroidota bacterium]
MKLNTVYTRLILIIGIVLLINFFGSHYDFRIDLTSDQRYTLTDGSKRVMEALDDPVTIKAYISEDVNTQVDNYVREVQAMLDEYVELSDGNLDVVYINPNGDPDLEQEAVENGVQPQQLQSASEDEFSLKKLFLGLVFEYGNEKELVMLNGNTSMLEYQVSKSIKKLTFENKPKVGILAGHGESSMEQLAVVKDELSINYEPVEVKLDGEGNPLDGVDALMIVDPKDSFKSQEIKMIDAFFEQGKGILLAYSNNTANLFTGQGMANDKEIGLSSWLATHGVAVESNMIQDVSAFRQNVFAQPLFYFPMITNFANHPICEGLEQVGLFLTNEVTYSGNDGTFTPIMFTSERSGKVPFPTAVQMQKQWSDADFTLSNIPVAGALQKNNGAKMVVVGCGDFFSLHGQEMAQFDQQFFSQTNNFAFVPNAMDWLTGQNDLLVARNKGITNAPLDELEDDKVSRIKYMNFLGPVFLVGLYGFLRNRARKAKRIKWQTMNLEG